MNLAIDKEPDLEAYVETITKRQHEQIQGDFKRGKAVLFKKGKKIGVVKEKDLVRVLMGEVARF